MPGAIWAVGAFFWAVSFGVLRDFVWADLRKGLIDLRGIAISTRALIWLGLVLLALMVAALLLNDTWRAYSPLTAMPANHGMTGRGALLPTALVPATLFLLAAAWSFVLAGALHCHPLIRLGALAVYFLATASWANNPGALGVGLPADSWIGPAALLGVPAFFVLRWRAHPRPAIEFALLLLIVSASFVAAQARDVENLRQFGSALVLQRLETDLSSLKLLVLPLLLLIGVEVAGFTRQVAGWTAEIVTERLPRWAPGAALLLLLVWRGREVALEVLGRVEETTLGSELLAYAGALGAIIILGLVWWGVAGRGAPPAADDVAETAERYAWPLVVAYTGVQLVVFLVSGVAQSLPSQGPTLALQVQLSGLNSWLIQHLSMPWYLLVDLSALAAAVWLARRGREALALYLGAFGLLRLWWEATRPGRPLALFDPRGWAPVDAWWVVVCALLALVWRAQGRLTPPRVASLLYVVLIGAVLRQADFIENKFSPFFGSAGIAFIAFGFVWDVLTKGSWANSGTVGLPRASRILIYLGYALLTVTVITWYLAAHDLFTVRLFTGGGAMLGFNAFGRPMLYAIIAVTLATPATTRWLEDRKRAPD